MEAVWNASRHEHEHEHETVKSHHVIYSNKIYLLTAFIVFVASAYLDNIRGPLLPAIAEALGDKTFGSSSFLSLGNFGTFCGILLFATTLYRIQIKTAAFFSWIFCAATCLAALLVERIGIFPLAFGIGLVIAAVQSVANLLVLKASPEKVRSRNFCALHLMFGIGSFFAPIAAARVAEHAIAWQAAIALAAAIFVVGATLTAFFFPQTHGTAEREAAEPFAFNTQKVAVLGTFLLYTTAQVLTAQWMMNYLRTGEGFEPARAAWYVSAYFVVVTFSRIVSYFFVNEAREKFCLNFTLICATSCLALGHFWPAILIASAIQAPFYPIYLGRMSRHFSESPKRMTLLILLSAQLGLIVSHSLLARLTDLIGIASAYWIPAVAMALAAVAFNLQEWKWNQPLGEKNV